MRNDLITLLASLYSSPEDAVFFLQRVGLDPINVNLVGSSKHRWLRIIDEASKRDLMPETLRIAKADFPNVDFSVFVSGQGRGLESPDISGTDLGATFQPPTDLSHVLLEDARERLFEPFVHDDTAVAKTLVHLARRWIENRSTPLVIVEDFVADIRASLATVARAQSGWKEQWIRGDEFLNRAPRASLTKTEPRNLVGFGIFREIAPEEASLRRVLHALQHWKPTIFLIDFSRMILDDNVCSGPRIGELVGEAIPDFATWAADNGHAVVIAMPRFLLVHSRVEKFCVQNAWTYLPQVSNELSLAASGRFDKRFAWLLSSHSPELRAIVHEFFNNSLTNMPKSTLRDSANLKRLPILAQSLTLKGFYEPAFRIEEFCRGIGRHNGQVSLDADFYPAGSQSKIVGLIERMEDALEFTDLACLFAEAGAGKSTVLFQIERHWSLPRSSPSVPAWLPLLLEADDGDLANQLRTQMERRSFIEIPGQGRVPLTCHQLLSRIDVGLDCLRWLFRSPVYFLIDDADKTTPSRKQNILDQVEYLRRNFPKCGVMIASRDTEFHPPNGWATINLRPLTDRQFLDLIERNHGSLLLHDLLGRSDHLMSRHLRNPFLATLACRIAERDLRTANLLKLTETLVATATRRMKPELSRAWLPTQALALKKTDVPALRVQTEEDSDWLEQGRKAQLLRDYVDRDMIQFRHTLLLDYFAAKRLASEGLDMRAVLEKHFASDDDLRRKWGTVLRMLVGLVAVEKGAALIEYLRHRDLGLACSCVMEIARERKGSIPAGRAVLDQLADRIAQKSALPIDDRVRAAEALSFLDPRIPVESPLDGLVLIPAGSGVMSFQIGRYPVTNLEFSKFVEKGGYEKQKFWLRTGWEWLQTAKIRRPLYWLDHAVQQANYPVVGVCLYEALAYCKWLSIEYGREFRLPTSDEWDHAAHGVSAGLVRKLWVHIMQIRSLLRNKSMPSVAVHRGLVQTLRHWIGRHEAQRGAPRTFSAVPPISEAEPLEDLRVILDAVHEHLSQYSEQINYDGDKGMLPVGVFAPNAAGCHDFFGPVWQWCDSWLFYPSRKPSRTREKMDWPALVRGCPQRPAPHPATVMLGGYFDPFTRFHMLGFRICSTG
jgi:hypothetical protein